MVVRPNYTILTYSGNHYVSFKNTAVLRWNAAAKAVGNDYHNLSLTLMRKAGIRDNPDGMVEPYNRQTLYFVSEEHASAAADSFLDALRGKGVKV